MSIFFKNLVVILQLVEFVILIRIKDDDFGESLKFPFYF